MSRILSYVPLSFGDQRVAIDCELLHELLHELLRGPSRARFRTDHSARDIHHWY